MHNTRVWSATNDSHHASTELLHVSLSVWCIFPYFYCARTFWILKYALQGQTESDSQRCQDTTIIGWLAPMFFDPTLQYLVSWWTQKQSGVPDLGKVWQVTGHFHLCQINLCRLRQEELALHWSYCSSHCNFPSMLKLYIVTNAVCHCTKDWHWGFMQGARCLCLNTFLTSFPSVLRCVSFGWHCLLLHGQQ